MMSSKKLVVFCIFICSFAFAGNIIKEFDFPVQSLKFEYLDGYTLIRLKGCDLALQEVGKPIIPFANLNVLIPPSAEIKSIEILDLKRTEIHGEFLLYPAQPPRPISFRETIPFVQPDSITYQFSTEYPKKLTEIIPSGNKSGYRIGGVFLYPLQYIPREKKLILYERIRIKINYEENVHEVWSLTPSQKELFRADVRNLVINQEDIEIYSPPIRLTKNPDIDYVILTSATLESRFVPLINWLKKTGFWAETRTTTWVSGNYTGRDLQEKIRNFIRDYFTSHGTKYVLLAGDHSIIPSRQARAVAGFETGNIPCDLYYLDLQWSWDGNNNNIFGEASYDTVDLFYDLYGGRWSVETSAEVDTMISKFFTYIKNPDTLYQKRMLLPAAFLWPNHNHVQSQDSIANLSPAGWTDRVIDQGTNVALRWQVRDSLNTGFGFAHLAGHGNDYGVYISGSDNPMYYYTDPTTQTNYNKLAIVNSLACDPGNFEAQDCLAEEMMKARGSAIAVMMNSRYGWGTPPSIGPSELLDVRFYQYFFNRDSIRIANCHQSSKENYRNTAMSEQVWRWCYYELNLFGEPQMMMWEDYPKKMIATFADTIFPGNQTFMVSVTSQGSPLASAIVALWKGSEVFTKGTTNASGEVTFTIYPTTPGYMYVTVTAKNRIPYEDSSQVGSLPSDVGIETIVAPGNNGPINIAITPQTTVKNYGSNPQTNFNVVCSIVGPGGAFRYTNTQNVPSLAAGATTTVNFLEWTPTIMELCTVKMRTLLVGDENPANDRKTKITEILLANDVGVDEIIYPLETQLVNISMVPIARVKNFGFMIPTSFPVICSIVGNNGLLRYTNTQTVAPLASLDTARVNFSSWIPTIAELCTVKMRTRLTGDPVPGNDLMLRAVEISMRFLAEGFNDVTFPPAGWQSVAIQGTYNWERKTSNLSPICTPYEGEAMTSYESYHATAGSMARLITPAIALGTSPTVCSLKFFMYHNPAYPPGGTYGPDSVKVEYSTDGTNFTRVAAIRRYEATAGWTEHSVYLGTFSGTIYVGLLALSQYGNNMNVDYIRLTGSLAGIEQPNNTYNPIVTGLYTPKPNPVTNGLAHISFSLAEPSRVALKIYDASGRIVKTLVNNQVEQGIYNLTWNGTDDHNNNVAEGIYFYTLQTDKQTFTKKLILTR